MDKEFTFEGQRADEEVVLFRHQHPWVLARPSFYVLILLVIVVIAFSIFGASMISAVVLVAAILVGFFIIARAGFLYRNVMFIITDQRIINIDQSSVFGRKVQETELENIYNLSYNMRGFIRNMLNFGNIELTTEGDVNDRIVLKNIEAPHEVFEKLSEYRKRAMNNLNSDERRVRKMQ